MGKNGDGRYHIPVVASQRSQRLFSNVFATHRDPENGKPDPPAKVAAFNRRPSDSRGHESDRERSVFSFPLPTRAITGLMQFLFVSAAGVATGAPVRWVDGPYLNRFSPERPSQAIS